jgi:hypothetical protein
VSNRNHSNPAFQLTKHACLAANLWRVSLGMQADMCCFCQKAGDSCLLVVRVFVFVILYSLHLEALRQLHLVPLLACAGQAGLAAFTFKTPRKTPRKMAYNLYQVRHLCIQLEQKTCLMCYSLTTAHAPHSQVQLAKAWAQVSMQPSLAQLAALHYSVGTQYTCTHTHSITHTHTHIYTH